MRVPEPVRTALAGLPRVGTWDRVLALWTTDDEGVAHQCLLSRGSFLADEDTVAVVLRAGSGTCRRLRRSRRAVLAVIGDDESVTCTLVARAIADGSRDLTAVALSVADVRRDAMGVPLRPAMFWVDESLQRHEAWHLSQGMLRDLLAGGGSADST